MATILQLSNLGYFKNSTKIYCYLVTTVLFSYTLPEDTSYSLSFYYLILFAHRSLSMLNYKIFSNMYLIENKTLTMILGNLFVDIMCMACYKMAVNAFLILIQVL